MLAQCVFYFCKPLFTLAFGSKVTSETWVNRFYLKKYATCSGFYAFFRMCKLNLPKLRQHHPFFSILFSFQKRLFKVHKNNLLFSTLFFSPFFAVFRKKQQKSLFFKRRCAPKKETLLFIWLKIKARNPSKASVKFQATARKWHRFRSRERASRESFRH